MLSTWSNPNSPLPPDTIVEVGQPCCTRYAAHSTLMAIHSGYLRAALRTLNPSYMNEISGPVRRVGLHQNTLLPTSTSSVISTVTAADTRITVLYLPNVTAEQFTPLLNFMYTGFLQLTAENIFGVLLATHLLHMPRALELCRLFLSSSRTTLNEPVHAGDMSPTPDGGTHLVNGSYYPQKTSYMNFPTIVRPIASKPSQAVGLHFITPPAASQISLLPSAPFRSLQSSMFPSSNITKATQYHASHYNSQKSPSQSPIIVTEQGDNNGALHGTRTIESENKMDSITVDGEDDKEENVPQIDYHPPNDTQRTRTCEMVIIGENNINPSKNYCSVVAQPSIERQKAIAMTADTCGVNGVIIDIASCDGPVRFRRVLNVTYGCNKSNRSTQSINSGNVVLSDITSEGKTTSCNRSMRYATSFHKQMARNICDTGKLAEANSLISRSSLHSFPTNQHYEQQDAIQQLQQEHNQQKDENSQEDNTSYNNEEALECSHAGSSSYTCVYCKQSFKSHYCYQKHAKRHLIPLQLDNRADTKLLAGNTTARSTKMDDNISNAKIFTDTQRHESSSDGSNNSSARVIKREVKPLDMNVQYYPCKICGCKFPSYYFVHKHRKLCHAEGDDKFTPRISSRTTS